ncbi:MAG TPA: DUF1223 domain-containing protein [Candidatus Baltobacteraceae bacterium]|nr:DUF1223 domain-containing protein [Candidatus Baltobacteraceae bacterium]
MPIIPQNLFRAARVLALAAACAAASSASASAAERTPVLLELFTSEGCSSCPPADDLLAKLDSAQPVEGVQLIVLSEHVDYWNGLGWKDPFSSAAFTARQGTYARAIDSSSNVYTPELIVDGRVSAVASDEDAVRHAIARALSDTKIPVTISRVSQSAGGIRLHVDAAPLSRPATLYVAVADERDVSHVMAGENAGRTLSHVAVLRSLTGIGRVSAHRPISDDVSIPFSNGPAKRLRIVTFFQGPDGAVIALGQISISTYRIATAPDF